MKMTYEELLALNEEHGWDAIAHYAKSTNDPTLNRLAGNYFAAYTLSISGDIDETSCEIIQGNNIQQILAYVHDNEPRIKIIVDGVAEDEKGTGGLWDLAALMLSPNAGEQLQQHIYDKLRNLATYTHPEHEDNSGS